MSKEQSLMTAIKRIAAGLAVLAFWAMLAWVAGYDFDSRGFWQAYALLWATATAVGVAFGPFWED